MTARATAVFIPSPSWTRQGDQVAYDSDSWWRVLAYIGRRGERAKLRESHVKVPLSEQSHPGQERLSSGSFFLSSTRQVLNLHFITIASIKQAVAAVVGKMHSALTYQPVARCSVCRCRYTEQGK